ncbi:metallophosphoesterase [Lysobacter sp. LF1]|uniref:Metallophosphoesterase n=1 Tax=Lysobacter stagni TaxID=3045172 RepID=A0ABT6XIZ5_9GAMM|nr:metallophosphoesterase [Lysobacter sp. LF1]MDI9240038.1 metallophosphoesterase [Lysobacter sp. LF1]
MDKLLVKQCLFYGSWLAFPFIAWLLWRMRRPGRRLLLAVPLAASLLFVWARFVEPQTIVVRETTLPGTGANLDLALVSDIHLGVYKGRGFLERLVARLDALPVQAVVIAGDLTYEPGDDSLQALFAPLAQLQHPAYAVLGNHDQQQPGPDIDVALRAALRTHGVQVIEGRFAEGPGWRLAGLGDRWALKDDPAFLKAVPSPLPTIVVAHNPDSAMGLSPDDAAILLAGHTHGGQIRIPWLYRHVIPTEHDFDRGEQFALTPAGRVRVFTTSGVGEIGLPMRLFNPPVIDILHLRP